MSIRCLSPDDAPLWREVRLRMLSAEPENYGATYADWADRPLSDWSESLRLIPHVVSMQGDRAVGAMGLWPHAGQAARHRSSLVAVWLEPAWRGSGRAIEMLDEIVTIARERGISQIELNVRESNARAVRFYERCGFTPCGRIPNAYRCAEISADDLLMVRVLDA